MICFDTNVLTDMMLARPTAEISHAYFAQNIKEASASILSLQFLMYYAEKHHMNTDAVRKASNLMIWLPVTEEDTQWAFEHYDGKDYEDALQVSIALREGCTTFVTRDKKLAQKYADEIKIKLI